MVALLFAEDGAGTYLDWGVVHISLANLLVIVLMVVVFFAALLLPFPRSPEAPPASPGADASDPAVPR